MNKLEKDDILAKLIAGEADLPSATKKSEASVAGSCGHWARPVLLERAAHLRKLARFSEGSAIDTLQEFAAHRVQLSVQLRSGPAEVHEESSALFFVLDGRATLVTGGTLVGTKRVGRGEIAGSAIEGGSSQELQAGDVAHVSAGTPHQFLLAGESGFTCLGLRINETTAGPLTPTLTPPAG